jgi:hypothetical protein
MEGHNSGKNFSLCRAIVAQFRQSLVSTSIPGSPHVRLAVSMQYEALELFSLSADEGGGEGLGEELDFIWISPLPNPLPARSSQGEGVKA